MRVIANLFALGLLAALATGPADASPASDAPRLRAWDVPWPTTRPRDPSVAPDGRVWFVGQTGNYLAVFDPDTERFERFELPPDTRPHTVVVDGEGRPWVAGNGNGTILRYGPDGRLQETYQVPAEPALERRDPHTFAPDGRGRIWFTLQRGNAIGLLDTASGAMRLLPVATPNALPYGIVAAADGRPWAVLLGSNRLATVDPATLELTEVELPRADARPRRLGMGSDGRVWYVDFMQGYLGAYDPARRAFREWKAPSAESGPYAMAVDAKDRIWFVETFPQPNLLQGFDPAQDGIAWTVEVPHGGKTVRHMVFDPARNALWFGTDTNHLVRADLPR